MPQEAVLRMNNIDFIKYALKRTRKELIKANSQPVNCTLLNKVHPSGTCLTRGYHLLAPLYTNYDKICIS